MYLSVLLIRLGEAVFFGSFALLTCAVVAALRFHMVVVLYEEPSLRRRLDAECERHTTDAPRWLSWQLRRR